MPEIEFTLNGRPQSVTIAVDATLLELLREELGLTGAKEGCGDGECGACTVLLDGLPVTSCLVPATAIQGRRVETIEGVGERKKLHALQEQFLERGAVQCGFCTPGMIMSSLALIRSNPDPTEQEVREALAGNLCRCTGYNKIVEGVLAAAAKLRGEPVPSRDESRATGALGRSIIRLDGVDKVSGTALFAADMSRPDMLHAAMVLSVHPHARIKGIDPAPALAVPGVERVITAADIPGETHYGVIVKDQPFLPADKVCYAGEPIALVLAESARTARRAAELVRVNYEPLPCVFDPRQAMQPDAPLVHEGGNILIHRKIRKGDVEAGFARAEHIVERSFTTSTVDHAYLEPEAALAHYDGNQLVVECCSQGPHYHRLEVARMLGLPVSRVRVAQAVTGGGFGGKIDLLLQHFVALGTYLSGRPVKMVWNRRESFATSTKRHAFYLNYRFGADRDGRLTAAKAEVIGDTGAYASFGPAVLTRSATMALGPYDCPNVWVDAYGVFTNHPVSGAMRGFGAPQMSPCHEPLMDEIARRCGLSPIEVRHRNIVRPGSSTVTQQVLKAGVGALETLEKVAAAAGEQLAKGAES